MRALHERLNEMEQAREWDPLLLIPFYVLDFLCIHPFLDGNGRLARLIALLLLYHHGYEVGRYVSLERIIEHSKQSYYDTLYSSSQQWHKSRHDLLPWTEYFLRPSWLLATNSRAGLEPSAQAEAVRPI
jgi:Fic family protein